MKTESENTSSKVLRRKEYLQLTQTQLYQIQKSKSLKKEEYSSGLWIDLELFYKYLHHERSQRSLEFKLN